MDTEIIQRFQQNNERANDLLQFIEKQLPPLRQAAALKYALQVRERNLQLKKEMECWKERVIQLEMMSGVKQYFLPSGASKNNTPTNVSDQNGPTADSAVSNTLKPTTVAKGDDPDSSSKTDATQKQSKKESSTKENKKEKTPKAAKPDKQSAEETKEVDVSRLDLRVGRILNAKKHPDAESLYVEEIDVGEAKPRTVVSGLVKFVPLEEMQNRLVVVLCNLKPAKMRGVLSEAMVMCASTPDKVEILSPPPNSVPGDRVYCSEYPGEPEALLPPKKKIFEQVAPELKTDRDCNATYKSALLKVADKGVVKSATLTNVQIK